MEFLICIYGDKLMKPAYEIIVGILSRLINIEDFINNKNDNKIIMKLPNSNKLYDYIKIFFYNIDDLININIIEYFNLFLEIISHNIKLLLSKE